MCGIVGVIVSNKETITREKLQLMTDVLSHRGPDGSGQWISSNQLVGLGHRRLSVIDISIDGAQPMRSQTGRYVLSYNGEIYNFGALRKQLVALAHSFIGNSDTEVILAALEEWGIQTTLQMLNGMFAIAIWDQKKSELLLARDRLGIKPLYYSHQNNTFTFASELRPLVQWRGELPPISKQGLSEFLRLGYVPNPLSIFKEIYKLEPAHYLVFKQGNICEKRPYWNLTELAEAGHKEQFPDEETALSALETQLSSSINDQMVSDVPIGAFLSGGVDSSSVAALMQKQSTSPIKTFSIGFKDVSFNEAVHAAAVAKHLGTDHNELYIDEQDALSVIPSLAEIYDEPFADISQIPTHIVSKLAKEQVTVALSGDGGDELFAGYNRYLFVAQFWEKQKMVPHSVRKFAALAIAYPAEQTWNSLFNTTNFMIPKSLQLTHPGQKIHKLASIIPSNDLKQLYTTLTSKWLNPESILRENPNVGALAFDNGLIESSSLPLQIQQSLWDMHTYMVDDILTKVDRASMSVGLEARVPMLDHKMVELAWRIPPNMKIRGGVGKWILREMLKKYVPDSLINRPKAGFGVPINDWLRGSLREWSENYLSAEKLDDQGYFETTQIRQVWQQHLDKSSESGAALWTVLIFQQWLEKANRWL